MERERIKRRGNKAERDSEVRGVRGERVKESEVERKSERGIESKRVKRQ